MPGIFHQPIHRREFLKRSLMAGAAVVSQGCQSAPTESTPSASSAAPRRSIRSSDEEIHLALISDTHIAPGDIAKNQRGFDPCAQLRQIVPDILAASPRGVFLNGDAAFREGLPEDYAELKSLLDPLSRRVPVYIGLGNHDHRDNFKAAFTSPPTLDAGVANHHVLVVDEASLRFILLDSLLYVNKTAGLLGKDQRKWLGDHLAAHPDKPAILFVHHTLGDSDGELLDVDRLFEIIRPHPHVKAIFYGHSHAWNIGERQGVKLINLPAVGYSFNEKQPVGWVDARFRATGVDLTLHAIAGHRTEDGRSTRIAWT